jgi:putative membrane protein
MKITYYFSMLGIIFLFSCGNSNESAATQGDSTQANTDTAKAKDSSITASINQNDTKFANDAANIGMLEIAMGKVAEQNAKSKSVKDFGAMMVKDHTSAGDELNSIAATKHITLATSLSADDQKKVDDMKAKTGKNFDKTYIDMMIDGHKKAASEFEDEIKQGSDADLRAFATKTLDVIHTHLAAAEKCQSMEK